MKKQSVEVSRLTAKVGKKMFAALTPYVDRAKLKKFREGEGCLA